MIHIAQTVDRTFLVSSSLARAREALCDPKQQAQQLTDLSRLETIEHDAYRFVFKPTKVGSFEFNPAYAARYEHTEDGCRWSPVAGEDSMRSSGSIRLRSQADGRVEVTYHEEIDCNLDVGRVVGAILAPIARELLRQSIVSYLERSRHALEQS